MGRPSLPLCGECNQWMRCQKNEVVVNEEGGGVYFADRYECPSCGGQVVIGFGEELTGEVAIHERGQANHTIKETK